MLLPLGDHRLGRLVLDRIPRRDVRLLADDDTVHRRGRLQPCGRVHDVARDHRLAERGTRPEGDDRLAGVDRDSDLQAATCELAGAVAHDQCGAHRSLGVVSVRERRSEHSHDRIADELLDDAAERLDLAPHAIVVRREHCAHFFGVELLRLRGEPDEVDEDDGDDAALVPRRRLRGEGEPACETEARDLGVVLAAGWTRDHRDDLGSAAGSAPGERQPGRRCKRLVDHAIALGQA